jgi:hypothetical protein
MQYWILERFQYPRLCLKTPDKRRSQREPEDFGDTLQNIIGIRMFARAHAAQKRSTHGRTSISQDQALRGCVSR